MKTLLVLWLMSGPPVIEEISPRECTFRLALADAVRMAGHEIHVPEGMVTRIDCDGRSVVLALPPSHGGCEMEPAA